MQLRGSELGMLNVQTTRNRVIIRRGFHRPTSSSLEERNGKKCGPCFGAAKKEILRTERPVLSKLEVFVATGSVSCVNLQAVLTTA